MSVEQVTSVVADARKVLLVHRASPDGWCAGCLEFTCTFARFPCPQARQAQEMTSEAAGGDRT